MSPLLEREAELAALDAALASARNARGTVVRQVGRETFAQAILDVSAPFRRDDGSYRLENIFRFAVARPR